MGYPIEIIRFFGSKRPLKLGFKGCETPQKVNKIGRFLHLPLRTVGEEFDTMRGSYPPSNITHPSLPLLGLIPHILSVSDFSEVLPTIIRGIPVLMINFTTTAGVPPSHPKKDDYVGLAYNS